MGDVNTRQATSVNVDTVIRWKEDLRRIESERRELRAPNKPEKKLKNEEDKLRQKVREYKLQVDPAATDSRDRRIIASLRSPLQDFVPCN